MKSSIYIVTMVTFRLFFLTNVSNNISSSSLLFFRAEREAQLNELQEKHKRAGEVFQERMKQKLQRREFNKYI